MRVQIVDPSAQTPPFDHSLSAALARLGAEVELSTTRFVHGAVPEARGYAVSEAFYPRSSSMLSGSLRRRVTGLAEHVPGMLGHRRGAGAFDVINYQWLTLPGIDGRLLPSGPAKVWTTHGFLRAAEGGGIGAPRRALERMDAVIALSEFGAARLREDAGVPAERIEVIPHGVFEYLARLPERPLPPELRDPAGPVILSFGLIRPYKGVDVLLRAFAELEPHAELWIVGRPLGVDMAEIEALADAAAGRVRILTRFVDDADLPSIFNAARVVALPYRDVDQSGVLATALAFGKAIVASDVGGFGEVAAVGDGEPAIALVPPGDAGELAATLSRLLGDRVERERLQAAAQAAAAGPYSWDRVAAETLALYERLASR